MFQERTSSAHTHALPAALGCCAGTLPDLIQVRNEQAKASHAAGLLGRGALFSSDEMIQGDVLRTMLDLICSLRHKSQLAGLGVLAGLAMTSPEAARKLLSPKLHQVCRPLWNGHSSLAEEATVYLHLSRR